MSPVEGQEALDLLKSGITIMRRQLAQLEELVAALTPEAAAELVNSRDR